MKFSLAGIAALAAAGMVAMVSAAQSPAPPAATQQPATQGTPPAQGLQPATQPASQPAAQNPQPGGKVIFSRSTDENGDTTTQAGPAATPPPIQMADAPTAEDAERRAVTFTDFDLSVHLDAEAHHLDARALVTVRNDGKTPLAHIPLQISSALNWEHIRVNGADVRFPVATLNSDTDHTGQLHEAAVALTQPLAPGASLELDVSYSGVIASSAQRLVALGAPEDVAQHTDWDRIGVEFTGLRGFGNVAWYPVSSVPQILGDGARLFDEIGEHKLRLSGARFRMRLTVEFPRGHAPTIAVINGHTTPLTVTPGLNEEVAGVATADTGETILGFESPSLFVAVRTPHTGTDTTVWALPEDEPSVEGWTTASAAVTPFLQGWLGQRPRSPLTVLDLPESKDAPFETGSLLAAPVGAGSPDQLEAILVHALAGAWMTPASAANSTRQPRAWLDEGVASFMDSLWTERRRGRAQALGALESTRSALALAEPASPGESAGQPLPLAISPVYYRTKAAYVFWMLRALAGDSALSAAFSANDPGAESSAAQKIAGKDSAGRAYTNPGANSSTSSSLFEKLLEQPGEKPIEQTGDVASQPELPTGAPGGLGWFFADWVDADKGLPDLSITGVYPTSTTAGNWLVAVTVANNGYAAAEVPVTVTSDAISVTEPLFVPARGKAVRRILIQGKPSSVQVNDGTVPETQASVHVVSLDQASGGPSSSSQPDPPQM